MTEHKTFVKTFVNTGWMIMWKFQIYSAHKTTSDCINSSTPNGWPSELLQLFQTALCLVCLSMNVWQCMWQEIFQNDSFCFVVKANTCSEEHTWLETSALVSAHRPVSLIFMSQLFCEVQGPPRTQRNAWSTSGSSCLNLVVFSQSSQIYNTSETEIPRRWTHPCQEHFTSTLWQAQNNCCSGCTEFPVHDPLSLEEVFHSLMSSVDSHCQFICISHHGCVIHFPHIWLPKDQVFEGVFPVWLWSIWKYQSYRTNFQESHQSCKPLRLIEFCPCDHKVLSVMVNHSSGWNGKSSFSWGAHFENVNVSTESILWEINHLVSVESVCGFHIWLQAFDVILLHKLNCFLLCYWLQNLPPVLREQSVSHMTGHFQTISCPMSVESIVCEL